MLLCVNIGNKIISFGFFEDECRLAAFFDISSAETRTSDEYISLIKAISRDKGIDLSAIQGAIISSVVPGLTDTLRLSVSKLTSTEPLVVGPGVKTGFHIKIDDPTELGADMVANTAAALKMRKNSEAVIVADLGPVNTVSAINRSGEYIGCAIFPGIELCFNVLHDEAALLPNIKAGTNSATIGKNSQSALRSGVLYGSAMAIDGFVDKFLSEMHLRVEEVLLIATGTSAQTLIPLMKSRFVYNDNLTLNGLYYIYKNNTSGK